ncbi:MAG: 2Fe-2S iron-sulfur cluster binding domain-containing protein [Bacteriovorax sp.]|nr:2Fe-2S iron-sulfur cluster binding domain-containing protein [Bacteriovorax sp.]
MSKQYKVTLRPSGAVVEVEEGKNLLSCLREQNIYIKSSCGGHATCSDCIIKVVAGEDYITPPPFDELKLLGNVFHITKERLACQVCVTGGDVTIDIAKHDKATDEDKLKNKASLYSKKKKVHTRVRKENEIEKIRADKELEREEFDRVQKQKTEDWKNHWEKEKEGPLTPKRLAGGKRPKFFDTDKVDYEKNDYTRPLSPEKQKLRDERLADKRKESTVETKQVDKTISDSEKDFKKFRG